MNTSPTKPLTLTPASGSDWVKCRVCGQHVRAFEAFAILGARVPSYICREPRPLWTPEHRTLPACAVALIRSGAARTISILEVKA